jgi:AcrR family transcriptional regulator
VSPTISDAPASDASAPPSRSTRSERALEVVAAARSLLESEGREALTMRHLGERLGMRAPSLYKHFADKAAIESALIEEALAEIGAALHDALAKPGRRGQVAAVLETYRRVCVGQPNLYRLATSGPLDRAALPPGLEEWAGSPFFLCTGEPHRAQALWSFAHGMVILEIDGRFPEGSDLDRTWRAGMTAFASSHPEAAGARPAAGARRATTP